MSGAELAEWAMQLDTQIRLKKKERSELEEDVTSVDGISNDKDKVQTSNLADRTAKGAVRLQTLNEQIAKLEEKRQIVLDKIDSLPGQYGYVVRKRCFDGESSADIGAAIGKSPRHVRRMIEDGVRYLSKK